MNKRIFKQLHIYKLSFYQNLRIQKEINEDSWFEGD
jgi:hypothetical protein